MAIDTRNKRSSAIHVGLPWRGMFPLADGTLDQADRQHGCGFYAGILAGEAAEVVVGASRLIRLMVGGGRLQLLTAGGAGVVKLRPGGSEQTPIKVGTSL